MKRIVKASNNHVPYSRHADKILSKMKDLLNAIEDAPDGFLEEYSGYGIDTIYDELIEDVPALDFAINKSGNAPEHDDMW